MVLVYREYKPTCIERNYGLLQPKQLKARCLIPYNEKTEQQVLETMFGAAPNVDVNLSLSKGARFVSRSDYDSECTCTSNRTRCSKRSWGTSSPTCSCKSGKVKGRPRSCGKSSRRCNCRTVRNTRSSRTCCCEKSTKSCCCRTRRRPRKCNSNSSRSCSCRTRRNGKISSSNVCSSFSSGKRSCQPVGTPSLCYCSTSTDTYKSGIKFEANKIGAACSCPTFSSQRSQAVRQVQSAGSKRCSCCKCNENKCEGAKVLGYMMYDPCNPSNLPYIASRDGQEVFPRRARDLNTGSENDQNAGFVWSDRDLNHLLSIENATRVRRRPPSRRYWRHPQSPRVYTYRSAYTRNGKPRKIFGPKQ